MQRMRALRFCLQIDTYKMIPTSMIPTKISHFGLPLKLKARIILI